VSAACDEAELSVNGGRGGELPDVPVVRTEDKRHGAVWVLRRCAYCGRRHTHAADPVLTSAIIPARCRPTAFYRLVEVAS
jgi:hypothetical protein